MSRHLPVARFLAALLGPALIPSGTRAQGAPAECRALVAAQEKQIVTPNHVYMTLRHGAPADAPITSETISVGGATYVMVQGGWMRSPMGPQELLAQFRKNLASARHYTCRRVGADTAGGVAATVYLAHGESAGVVSDTRTWVAKATGLPVRSEEDVDAGGADGKSHVSVRYDYTDVRAPSGAR